MIAAILAALVAMATRGECVSADSYPAPDVGGAPTYILLGDGDRRCAIPTTPEIPPRVACVIAQELANPTGLGAGIRCETPEERLVPGTSLS